MFNNNKKLLYSIIDNFTIKTVQNINSNNKTNIENKSNSKKFN